MEISILWVLVPPTIIITVGYLYIKMEYKKAIRNGYKGSFNDYIIPVKISPFNSLNMTVKHSSSASMSRTILIFSPTNKLLENIQFHNCPEIKTFNQEHNMENDKDNGEDKSCIMKYRGRSWDLCVKQPVYSHDTEDVESISIKFCPYCGELLK